MREHLATLAVGLPTERGRELAEKLEVAIFNSLMSAQWFVRDLLTHHPTEGQRERAKMDFEKAIEIRNDLAQEVRSLS